MIDMLWSNGKLRTWKYTPPSLAFSSQPVQVLYEGKRIASFAMNEEAGSN
jgi:hypothetical protein